jgi:hypothetical protein
MKQSQINKIAKTKKITHCYIYKNGRGYYNPGSAGYTDYRFRAGVYTKAEAISHAEKSDEIYLKPIDIASHNKMLFDEAQAILSRMIF